MKAPTTEYQSNGFGAFNENEKKKTVSSYVKSTKDHSKNRLYTPNDTISNYCNLKLNYFSER